MLKPTRRWQMVRPPNNKMVASPVTSPTTCSMLAARRRILMRDEHLPLPNMIDQTIASAINGMFFHHQIPAHIWIMNARRNAKIAITAITQQNPTADIALWYRDIIITGASTFDTGVVDVEENRTWDRLMIHTVPRARSMGKGTEGLKKMREEFEAANLGMVIPS